jgi:nitrate reductase cytochrome c-type subunit
MIFIFSQEAETNAKIMELEISKLQKKLEEKNEQLQASTSSAQKVSNYIYLIPMILFKFQGYAYLVVVDSCLI